jgi:predicted RNase H-like HicB family nuclease
VSSLAIFVLYNNLVFCATFIATGLDEPRPSGRKPAALKPGEDPMQIVAIIHKSAATYGVSFPDLPGCIAAGTTEQEALTNAAAAVAFHIEHMSDHGSETNDDAQLDRP